MSVQRSRRERKPSKGKPARAGLPPWLAWIQGREGGSQTRPYIILLLGVLLVVDLLLANASWVPLSRRLLGWGAYPLALLLWAAAVIVLAGERLRFAGRWEALVGLEVFLVALLALTHRWGDGEKALAWAEQGRGGGLVGWVISMFLGQWLGPLLGRLLLLLFVALGLWMMYRWAPLGWREGLRMLVAAGQGRAGEQGGRGALEEVEPTRAAVAVPPPAPPRRAVKKKEPRPKAERPLPERPADDRLPPLDLLHVDRSEEFGDTNADYKSQVIEQTLSEFGVPVRVVDVKQGPTVTQFAVQPLTVPHRRADGTVYDRKVSVQRILRLSNDLALALAASPIRIEAPVPGYPYVGIEVPNDRVALVALRGVLESPEFRRLAARSNLAIALGRNVSGEPVVADLAAMPHLLIAGATGSGKSVCINAIITCLLFHNTPETLRLLLMDPKMVELPVYNGIPHLLAPVVVELEQAVGALTWLTLQMDERYRQFHAVQARNIDDYNRLARRRRGGSQTRYEPLPHIVLVIDELADMMMVAPDEVERSVCRLAQMSRATGIHLVVATQRPSVDVVTGLIKANFPARIAFTVTSQVDSRVILDQAGAEQLLGRGDMLFMSPEASGLVRAQGCFVTGRETQALVNFWRRQGGPQPSDEGAYPWEGLLEGAAQEDELFDQAVALVRDYDRVSTSFLQRKLRIGFPRAARLMEILEEEGIVGPDEGGGRGREVLRGEGVDNADEEEW
ncbi:MAG: DNA translocase FtsK [Anaerolineae bacterium]|nr:DNA translocase FtsK [Anaerolineae bacterium]